MAKAAKKGSKKGKAKKVIEDPKLVRELCAAASLGDLQELQRLFNLPPHEKKFEINQTASESLWRAAEQGHAVAINYLLDQGLDINLDDGKSLQFAAANGKLSAVKVLCERGADINCPSTFTEWTALHFAAKNGHLDVVDYLVKQGAIVGIKTNEEHNGTFNGWSPLHFAADEGHLDICQFLVEVGKCVIDLPNSNMETALALAAEHGRFDIVRYLVTAGANIHATRRGLNVVQWAIYRCNPDTVQFLVSYGAKADMGVKVLWFPTDMSLREVISAELSPPLFEKLDLAIYRGSVRLQERASHMRALSEVMWEEGTLYDPVSDEPQEPSKELFTLPKHMLHLISAYEI